MIWGDKSVHAQDLRNESVIFTTKYHNFFSFIYKWSAYSVHDDSCIVLVIRKLE